MLLSSLRANKMSAAIFRFWRQATPSIALQPTISLSSPPHQKILYRKVLKIAARALHARNDDKGVVFMQHFMTTLLLFVTPYTLLANSTEPCSVNFTGMWKEMTQHTPKNHRLNNQWIAIGTLSFHKKTTEEIPLKTIEFTWVGPTITNLHASLFRKEPHKPFMPIDKYFVCDGAWHPAQQRLSFQFNDYQKLGCSQEFCLVLSCSHNLQELLRDGSLQLVTSTLPTPLQGAKTLRGTSLALNTCMPPAFCPVPLLP